MSDCKAYYFSSVILVSVPRLSPVKRLLPIWLICKGLIQAVDWRLDADDRQGPFNRSIAFMLFFINVIFHMYRVHVYEGAVILQLNFYFIFPFHLLVLKPILF